MFLPDELRKHVETLKVNGEPLVLASQKLSEASEKRIIPETPPANALPALITGLLSGALILLLQRLRFRWKGRGRKMAAFLFFTLMLLLSLTGLLLWFISFFTDHQVARENINVLLIHPFYLIPGILLIKERGTALARFWMVQGIIWLAMAAVNLLAFHQGNLRTVLFFMGLLLLQTGGSRFLQPTEEV